jgi:hypothetical protein
VVVGVGEKFRDFFIANAGIQTQRIGLVYRTTGCRRLLVQRPDSQPKPKELLVEKKKCVCFFKNYLPKTRKQKKSKKN